MRKILLFAIFVFASAALALGAEEVAGIPGLNRFKLANGLEVYAYRDSAVPLARIQIVFKTGAISQGPDTAGLFHLYEHMLFRGSAAYPGSAGVKAALASLGVSEWNGGTGTERVDYWITLPSSEVARALAFWADTLISPTLDADALEAEKEVVVQEIRGRAADPDTIYEAALSKRLFARYPWRRDPAGSEKAVRAATVASLRTIASTWFVPNNAAIFVGGDVDPEEVRTAAEEAFGGWSAGPDPWSKALPQNPKPGVVRPTWIVYPDPSMPEGIGRIEARYRGPDLAYDPVSSYPADLWSSLVSPQEGRFKTALAANVPKLGGKDGMVASYVSQRDGGWISIASYFVVDPALPSVDRARAFKERERAFEITSMKTDPSYFSADEYEAARKRLLDYRAMATDTAEGMIETLAFWWAAASIDYFAGYPAALARTGPKEVSAFLDSYIMRNLEVVALRMNPADVEKEKRSFALSGFDTVSDSNAFWWQK
jgi:zinc protease